jgi:HEAT repeat protein
VDLLIAALGDPDSMVRTGAAVGLAALGDKRAVEPLIAKLKDENAWTRSMAASLLPRFEDARAIEPLAAALEDPDRRVRIYAALGVMKLKDPRGEAFLLDALKDPDPKGREETANILAILWIPTTAESSRKGDNPKPSAQQLAEYAWAMTPLTELLADPEPKVRAAAAAALGFLQDPRALRPLIKALSDDSLAVRYEAVRGLAKLEDEAAVEPILALTTDLMKTGHAPPTRGPMGGGLMSRENAADFIWSYIFIALSRITGEPIHEDRIAWEEWWQAHQAAATAK